MATSLFGLTKIISAIAQFLQKGSGAVARTVQEKLYEDISVTDFLSAAQKADVLAGTLTLDCRLAFDTALASANVLFSDPFYNYLGRVKVPKGKYRLDSTLNIIGAVSLIGEGQPDGNSLGSTQLWFADNTNGIVIHDYRTSSNGKDAGGTIIQGLSVICNRTSGTIGSGIWLRTRARIRDVLCYNFREHGIRIDATSGGSPEGNANNWEVTSARLISNGLHGLFIDGADVNAGIGTRIDASSNGRIGIFDSSFLGNTYVACHAASNGIATAQISYFSGRYYVVNDTLGGATTPGTNATVWELISNGRVSYGGNRYACLNASLGTTNIPGTNPAVWSLIGAGGVSLPEFPLWTAFLVYHADGASSSFPAWSSAGYYYIGGPYRTDNANARNVFIGCYSESGQPGALFQGPGMIIGGLHGAGISRQTNTTLLIEGMGTQLTFPQNADINDAGAYKLILASSSAVMALRDANESSGSFLFRLKGTTGSFYWDWANDNNRLQEFTNSLATVANGFPREVATRMGGAAGIGFRKGYFLGSNMKFIGTGTAIPAAGTYVVGDIIYNEAPASAGFIGWVCTGPGTPGTWKTFGLIS